MANYLLDTNILIDLVLHKKTASFFSNLNAKQPIFYTSLICISEFIAGANSTENRALVKWVETQQLKTLGFETLADAQLAADLRKKTKLKLPDAIILSAAIQNKNHLLTNDLSLLEKAKHYISVTNPFDYE